MPAVLGAGVTLGALPLSFPFQARRPGEPCPGLPALALGRLAFAACLWSAGRAGARSWGWAGARSEVGVFCARAPPRPARGGAEVAPGRPRAGWGLALALVGATRTFSGFPSRASSLGSLRRAKLVLPRAGSRASPATLAYPLVVVTWGRPALEPGLGPTPCSSPLSGRASVFSWVKWGQEGTQPRRMLVNSGRELVHDRSVTCQQVTFG